MKRSDIYLNEFHRQQHEQAKKPSFRRPRQSLADAMRQYDRIKQQVQGVKPQPLYTGSK